MTYYSACTLLTMIVMLKLVHSHRLTYTIEAQKIS